MSITPKEHIAAMCRTFRLLTVLPLPYMDDGLREDGTSKVGIGTYTSMVGIVLALLLCGFFAVTKIVIPLPSELTALLIAGMGTGLLGALTRLMHFDAVADVCDGFWGGYTVERRLEIMKDSTTGSFGVAGLTLYILIFSVSCAILITHQSYLLLVPTFALARLTTFFAGWLGKSARKDGLGISNIHRPKISEFIVVMLVSVGAISLGFLAQPNVLEYVAVSGVSIFVAAVIPHLLSKRFGGMTGDVFGASVIAAELVTLVLYIFFVVL